MKKLIITMFFYGVTFFLAVLPFHWPTASSLGLSTVAGMVMATLTFILVELEKLNETKIKPEQSIRREIAKFTQVEALTTPVETTFTISEQDKKKIAEWKLTLPYLKNATYQYVFSSSNGIGTSVDIVRNDGEKLDLTDYGSW